MGEISEILEEITTEQIETHIKNLVGIRHPVFAPEALEDAAKYICNQLQSLGYKTGSHHFSEDDKQYRTVGRPLLQKMKHLRLSFSGCTR